MNIYCINIECLNIYVLTIIPTYYSTKLIDYLIVIVATKVYLSYRLRRKIITSTIN